MQIANILVSLEGITRFDALPAVRSLKFPEYRRARSFPAANGRAAVTASRPEGGRHKPCSTRGTPPRALGG
jgi:hypothetical protein